MKTQKPTILALLFSAMLFSQQSKTPSFMYVTPQNLGFALREQKAAFIINAFHNGFDTKEFEAKYGVKIRVENCVVMPTLQEKVNNKTLSDYLTNRFGSSWKEEIPVLPFGI